MGNDNSNPPPFSYYHILNLMVFFNGLALAYALLFLHSPFVSTTIMSFMSFVVIGLREVRSFVRLYDVTIQW